MKPSQIYFHKSLTFFLSVLNILVECAKIKQDVEEFYHFSFTSHDFIHGRWQTCISSIETNIQSKMQSINLNSIKN